jgi:hypothetical protein
MANEPKTDKQQAADTHALVERMNDLQADADRQAKIKEKGEDDG